MDYLYIVILSLSSLIVLFILTKLMGNREISQLSMFDYIIGITIGSITAEMATALEDYKKPLIAMVVYGLAAALISIATNKSLHIRRFIVGKPLILYDNGKLFRENLKKAMLDINEFLTECRSKGYFDLSNIEMAIFETNGKISIIPKSDNRPATPKDLQLNPEQERPVYNIIIDGQILTKALNETGNDQQWLDRILKAQGIHNLSEVFLATCDNKNNLRIYKRTDRKYEKDLFV